MLKTNDLFILVTLVTPLVCSHPVTLRLCTMCRGLAGPEIPTTLALDREYSRGSDCDPVGLLMSMVLDIRTVRQIAKTMGSST
jgi:hypothetical protein